jgi:hypothetical protein
MTEPTSTETIPTPPGEGSALSIEPSDDLSKIVLPGPAIPLAGSEGPGPFVFSFPDGEFLRFCADGRVFVRGELVHDNQVIYSAVAAFFQRATRCTACHGELAPR